jgi:hypothetical protein
VSALTVDRIRSDATKLGLARPPHRRGHPAGPAAETESSAADRREVDPPIEVDAATWSHAGQFDWWVKERQEWWGRVPGADGRQRWIRAVRLRPASGSPP